MHNLLQPLKATDCAPYMYNPSCVEVVPSPKEKLLAMRLAVATVSGSKKRRPVLEGKRVSRKVREVLNLVTVVVMRFGQF